ncbi:MAG: single-stranded-DNA-specific exonuclease RecJ [Saprospiraceae bacterium]
MKRPKWIWPVADPVRADALARSLNIHRVLAALLIERGISDAGSAERYFRPALEDLHSPWLMRDMDRAVWRLECAFERGERILLYGDYDVDGVCSVAMMYEFLRFLHPHIDYYLPDRLGEGYGLSLQGVDYARSEGCSLLLALDCGIRAQEAIVHAQASGIDVIVCDHHLPEGALPGAVAVLNPMRPDCDYPCDVLSACGVAFKLAQAIAERQSTPVGELRRLFPFVALSTACDIVPMIGENRILTRYGLFGLNNDSQPGIDALIEVSGRRRPLDVSDLVYGIGPMINAAGRLAHAREAVAALLSADPRAAMNGARRLAWLNAQRRAEDARMADEAATIVRETQPNSASVVVCGGASWRPGLLGITAGRLAEQFYRPAVVLAEQSGLLVGSARSVPGFDLYDALKACAAHLVQFGGHKQAAGLRLRPESLAAFHVDFEAAAQLRMTPEIEQPVLSLAGELPFSEITHDFWRALRRFEPFGPKNRRPVFVAKGVRDTGASRLLRDNHAQLALAQQGVVMRGIAFGQGDLFERLRRAPMDVAYNIEADEWRGERRLRLLVKDLRASEGDAP